MLTTLIDFYATAAEWSNDNQGVVSLAIFIVTIAFGWASGIFSALRRKPKFKLSLIDGPTFCCTYAIGKAHGDFEAHRTGIALYLVIANVGSAASSIENISIGYHWHLRRFSLKWLKYSVGWFWLTNQSAALADFQVTIGQSIKVYPFLTQKNHLPLAKVQTYLEVGRSTNGVVYFEQSDSWGGCYPTIRNGFVRIKVRVLDVFGNPHTAKFWIPSVAFDYARTYNPAFGKTLAELHGEVLPFDKVIEPSS
ncbi:MAG: hypothetical protein Q7K57_11090 [Burkholderiaceae bacterium]|nr:hypothetical protein [Burkholderiaceae bacterium]